MSQGDVNFKIITSARRSNEDSSTQTFDELFFSFFKEQFKKIRLKYSTKRTAVGKAGDAVAFNENGG